MGFEISQVPQKDRSYEIDPKELEGVKPEDLYDEAVSSVKNVEKWAKVSGMATEILKDKYDEQEIKELFSDPSFREKSIRLWKDQSNEELASGLRIRAEEELAKRQTIR